MYPVLTLEAGIAVAIGVVRSFSANYVGEDAHRSKRRHIGLVQKSTKANET